MDRSTPYQHGSLRLYRAVAWCSVLLTTAVVLNPVGLMHSTKWKAPRLTQTVRSANTSFAPNFQQEEAEFSNEGVLPTILNEQDIATYKAIFEAQKTADWTTADAQIGALDNHVLLGYVLADRYQNPKYAATSAELATWVGNYGDHPQAAEIYNRAVSKDPELRQTLPEVKKASVLPGYGDMNSMASKAYDTPYAGNWREGLNQWRIGHKAAAAKYFVNVANHADEISPWMASAASYWAYRSYDAAGNAQAAAKYLNKAAEYPRSFYGILARKQLKMPLGLDNQPVELTDSDVLQMVGDQPVRRIVALSQTGLNELAETELRLRFRQGEDEEKPRLLALAHELGLASVQISMAHDLGVAGRELDFARYPIPNLQPDGGYKVDPLLIFSLMKQESGFRQTAVSPVGALGLMQLMPKTASLMHKQMYGDTMNSVRLTASEPIVNITLGQSYVEHLLTNPMVEGNLFYLLAAYNAGPGRLQEWKAGLNYKNDPLLFVESIPFGETHHYVMQVMTNYWIYSDLIGGSDTSLRDVAQGQWPSYQAYGSLASNKDAITETAAPDSGA